MVVGEEVGAGELESGLFKPTLVIQEAAEDEWFSWPFFNKVSLPLSPPGSLGETLQLSIGSVGYLLQN